LFTSIVNFRDLGGTLTSGGDVVRSGRFYRSDSLAKLALSEADVATFVALGIRTVVDLQRPSEIAVHGHIDLPGLRYVNIAPDHEPWDPEPYDAVAGPARYLADRYLDMVYTGGPGFAAAVAVLADEDSAPAVVHCYAGKDRTGVLTALTLSLLDVDDEVIADDYAISDVWSSESAPAELPYHFVAAPRDAMVLFLRDFRTRYGSAVDYLSRSGFTGADADRLRRHLLG
jgi:protein-tyrosine phosphatase